MMNPNEVEQVYEALANVLDQVGASKRELYLAKLALLLAHEIGDASRVQEMIDVAALNLEV